MLNASVVPHEHFRFAPDPLKIILTRSGGGGIAPEVDGPSSFVLAEFTAAVKTGVTEQEIWRNFGAFHTGMVLHPYYLRLRRRGLIGFEWSEGKRLLLTIEPLHAYFSWRQLSGAASLSRFACLRRTARGWLLESPQAACEITLHEPDLGAYLLSTATDSEPRRSTLFEVLDRTGFTGRPSDESEDRYWEFHDKLFHYHSTRHSTHQPFGATYRFRVQDAAPPMSRSHEETPDIRLEPPAQGTVPPELARALSSRCSTRQHGANKLSLQQLSDLLYLAVRVIAERESEPKAIRKNYPSAGSIHELRAYVIAQACEGLTPGIYKYDDQAHGLTLLPRSSRYSEQLMEDSAVYWGRPDHKPQVVLLLTSRVDLLAWKYEKLAYRLALLNAGCAIETIHLASSALQIACCALGGIDGALFDVLEKLREIEGTPIVKIALGSLPGIPVKSV